ncbi:DUF881 domain-containing protein [Phytoactinopolyspora alkaliphila]|uniref:DUF881 domain-containing protein n=1 Tax=Phytoactinopolyspora alkaliphila TaxID=1783498 RepID=A0A6N9YK55_9ACTN|nr:DUF881 domain-containing protein [Phytoactinopolyspora alkaliphila]NED95441.1 DUF881 domain-containing protein [Phytoactinopolyspora alkaliphila]
MSEPAARGRGWKVAAPLVLALCGMLLVISAKTSGGTDLRGSDLLGMPDLVRAEERRVQELAAQVEDLKADVDSLTSSRGDHETKGIQEEIESLRPSVGMTPVEGQGLTVTLDDAPRPGQDLAPNTHIEDYIVHQQDLEGVMNALWAGGAEAMMVMDQRIGAGSTVRCVGSVLLLEGRKYSPPYQISAIGDAEAMQAALNTSESVQWYRAAAEEIGLGYELELKETITMPAYEGSSLSGSRS